MGGDLGGAVKGFKDGMKDGGASAEDKPAAQVTGSAADTAKTTIDVEAKQKL
jgi:sec-independent protein translocase protein TatA